MITGLSALLIVCGVLFFTAGTAGLIRFPDVRSQLHALTKADNIGLGLIMAGAALYLGSWSTAVLLAIVLGTLVAVPMGLVDFSSVGSSGWFGIATPFHWLKPAEATS